MGLLERIRRVTDVEDVDVQGAGEPVASITMEPGTSAVNPAVAVRKPSSGRVGTRMMASRGFAR